MSYLPQILTGIISLLFGSLVTFFLKAVSEQKTVDQIVRGAIRETLGDISSTIKAELETHTQIYHSQKTATLIEAELRKYDNLFDLKLAERDKRIDALQEKTASELDPIKADIRNVKETLHKIELHFMKLVGYFDNKGLKSLADELTTPGAKK